MKRCVYNHTWLEVIWFWVECAGATHVALQDQFDDMYNIICSMKIIHRAIDVIFHLTWYMFGLYIFELWGRHRVVSYTICTIFMLDLSKWSSFHDVKTCFSPLFPSMTFLLVFAWQSWCQTKCHFFCFIFLWFLVTWDSVQLSFMTSSVYAFVFLSLSLTLSHGFSCHAHH